MLWRGSDTAGEKFPHGIGRSFLGRGGYVGIGVQGEPGAEVPQHAGHSFDVHTVLQRPV